MCFDRLPIFNNQAFNVAECLFAILFCPEHKILESVAGVMSKFGVINPPQENIIMVAETFLGMMRYTLDEGEEETRERYFAVHGAAHPVPFRQAFKAATTHLSSWSSLLLSDVDHRSRVHANRYFQTSDDPISNPFMLIQASLHIDMFAHPRPLTYLRDIRQDNGELT